MTIQCTRNFRALAFILYGAFWCGAFPTPASAQQIENVVGAPFTATFSRTTPGQPKLTCQIARASDGSVYFGCSGANGRLSSVEISDVPNNRRIALWVPPPNLPRHTYTLSTPRDGKFTTVSADDLRQRLRHGQSICSCKEESHTTLGQRFSDGLTLFGFRSVKTYDDGSKRVTEYWESDLGVVVSRKDVGPQADEEHSCVVTDVLREEPDPSLFLIPKEYLSDPLLDAKTIYIENLTDVPEVANGAVIVLDAWKASKVSSVQPLIAVQEKNAADLTATFTKVRVVEGASRPGIRLEVYPRSSTDPAYQVTLALDRDSVAGYRQIAMQCFDMLWNRLASTQVGLRPQPEGSKLKAQAAK
jgi:hypothetical protein